MALKLDCTEGLEYWAEFSLSRAVKGGTGTGIHGVRQRKDLRHLLYMNILIL